MVPLTPIPLDMIKLDYRSNKVAEESLLDVADVNKGRQLFFAMAALRRRNK
jgi:hypothetical protein